MRPKTGSSRGAIELPLTYLYAVLIGIVVFIIATRIIAAQAQSTDEVNTQTMLDAFDELISGAAQNPNVIQPVELARANVRFTWEEQTRMRIGKSSTLIGVPVFSEERLGERVGAWTYPYRIEAASSPILLLSDEAITYQVSGSGSGAIMNELPTNAGQYGLVYVTGGPSGDPTIRDLCTSDLTTPPNWNPCELRLISQAMPYGYVSWRDDAWYPVVTYAEILGAHLADGEDEWSAAITSSRARDRINRDLLIRRAEAFATDTTIATDCGPLYQRSIGNLTAIRSTIATLDMSAPRPSQPDVTTLSAFLPIPSAITNLTSLDRELSRFDCPGVIR